MKALKITGLVAIGIVFFTLYVFCFMYLWNWLMPFIFSLPVLTFWQSLGFLILLKMMFLGSGWGKHRKGRFRHSKHHYCDNHPQREKWKAYFKEKWGIKEEKETFDINETKPEE